ncbi:MAG: 1-phosphofructokinase family hexose kinase [Oscillospiraceae bacterium]|nr:1-phosphofructokinase family hexose kinase [Oscillospiraceae bacterium]
MIYTVTLNPSVDYSMHPASLCEGGINRSEYEFHTFGGKGINVSAMLSALGTENVALGFVGGFSGHEIERLATRAGVSCDFCEITDTSRINVKVLYKTETAINGKGPFIRLEEEADLLRKLGSLSSDDTVILSGSAPESESGCLLENVIDAASHTRFIADMEGQALLSAIEKKPFLIKPNEDELAALFGKRSLSEGEIAAAARELRERGVGNVLVSRGGEGALLAAEDGNLYKICAPKVEVVSTVGAGDSFLAGFVAGYDRGFEFALALATAAGSATAANDGIADGTAVMAVFAGM